MESLTKAGWIQVQADGLTIVPQKEKEEALRTGKNLALYWVQVAAVAELLEKKP
jgi:ribosomal protein S30